MTTTNKPQVVIFCGGLGTRLREETEFKPKPLVEIGGKPILWHIMKIYSHYGFKDFVLCLGYKGDLIKKYFMESSDWKGKDFTLSSEDDKVLIKYHQKMGKIATVTSVRPRSPFGLLYTDGNGIVAAYEEKPVMEQQIN